MYYHQEEMADAINCVFRFFLGAIRYAYYVCSTPLLQDWLGDDAAKRQRREIHFPTGRFGEAIEQAQAVLFLASDESGFVNGTDFVVDGGMTKVRFNVSYSSISKYLLAFSFLHLGKNG